MQIRWKLSPAPPALVPSRQEKRDTEECRRDSRRRRRTGKERGTRDGKKTGVSVPGSWRFMRPKSRALAGNETSRGKRVVKADEGIERMVKAREGERAVDFLREVLSHDLVVARKIENTARITKRRLEYPESSDECRSEDRNKDRSPEQVLNSLIRHKLQYVIPSYLFFHIAQTRTN